MTIRSLLVCTASVLAGPVVLLDAAEWTYVAEASESGFQPVARSMPLSPEVPEDVDVQVTWRGTQQWFAQIRYGNEASVRVVFVVDLISNSEFDLYVDRNRDRILQAIDRMEGQGRERSFELQSVMAQEDFVTEYSRHVQFRLGITGNQFGLATTGYVAGIAQRDGRPVRVRLVDGDVNGMFADDRDRIRLDLNGDNQWDPLTEQFPFRPMLVLNDECWAVRTDRAGTRFALEKNHRDRDDIAGDCRTVRRCAGLEM